MNNYPNRPNNPRPNNQRPNYQRPNNQRPNAPRPGYQRPQQPQRRPQQSAPPKPSKPPLSGGELAAIIAAGAVALAVIVVVIVVAVSSGGGNDVPSTTLTAPASSTTESTTQNAAAELITGNSTSASREAYLSDIHSFSQAVDMIGKRQSSVIFARLSPNNGVELIDEGCYSVKEGYQKNNMFSDYTHTAPISIEVYDRNNDSAVDGVTVYYNADVYKELRDGLKKEYPESFEEIDGGIEMLVKNSKDVAVAIGVIKKSDGSVTVIIEED